MIVNACPLPDSDPNAKVRSAREAPGGNILIRSSCIIGAVFPVCLALAVPLSAAAPLSGERAELSKRQIATLGAIAPKYRGSLRPQFRNAVTPEGQEVAALKQEPVADSPKFLKVACELARRYEIPEDVFLRLIMKESRWDAEARSSRGAIGLTQLMPATARSLGVNPHDPVQNLEGGARYLAEQYRVFGSWRLAVAAYNAGPYTVKKYGDVPPFPETQRYVREVLGQV